MGCPKLTYNFTALPRLQCIYNAANGEEKRATNTHGTTTIYTINERDHFGMLKKYTFGNGVETTRTYSDYASPKTIVTKKTGSTAIVDQSYTFDDTKGLLTKRKDITNGNIEESFLYDNQRRLTNYNITGLQNTVVYSSMGNITSKTDAGTFTYNVSGKPYTLGQHTPPAPDFDTGTPKSSKMDKKWQLQIGWDTQNGCPTVRISLYNSTI